MTKTLFRTSWVGICVLQLLGCKNSPIAGETSPDANTQATTGGTTNLATGGTTVVATGGFAGGTADISPDSGFVLGRTFTLPVKKVRQLDMLFMIDNSLSMEPFQAKLKMQFPKVIQALKDPTTGQLPDLRIALITSDVGTGASGLCTPRYGDQGKFQIPNGTDCGVNPGARWLEHTQGKNMNFNPNRDIADVFGCLATGIGQTGCGLEQQLQSIYFSMFFTDPATQKTQAQEFLRPEADLAIVMLSNEDDCSTPLDSLMAQDSSLASTESFSLRCATRGHACSGQNLAYPTTQSFSAALATCSARTDTCPAKEKGEKPTTCSPLENVQQLAQKIKSLKPAPSPSTQAVTQGETMVFGIFGLPREGEPTVLPYRIAKSPNPAGNDLADLFDLYPICTDPNHPLPADPSDKEGVKRAFGQGAFPGLRLASFVNAFGANGMMSSICEADYSSFLSQMGTKLAGRQNTQCLPVGFSLAASWQIFLRVPSGADYVETPMAECDASSTSPCVRFPAATEFCPGSGLALELFTSAQAPLPENSVIRFQRD